MRILLKILIFSLVLVILFTNTVSAFEKNSLKYEDVGISVSDVGDPYIDTIATDKNVVGDSSQFLVTIEFYLFIGESGDVFYDTYQLYKAGVISSQDFLRIGYPNYIQYQDFSIELKSHLLLERVTYYRDFYITNRSNYNYDDYYYNFTSDRELNRDVYLVTFSYYQSSSVPSYQSCEGDSEFYPDDELGYSLNATNADYIYSGVGQSFSNFFIWSPVIPNYEWRTGIEYSIIPFRISADLPYPKVTSWASSTTPMTVYTCCTYFDMYNFMLQCASYEGYIDTDRLGDNIYKYSQSVILENSVTSISDSLNKFDFQGVSGWIDPYSAFDYGEKIGGFTDSYVHYGLRVNELQYSAGDNVEYSAMSVTFYRDFYFNFSDRYFLIWGGYINDFDTYDNDIEMFNSKEYDEWTYFSPLFFFRPYVGAWVSYDQSTKTNLSYDGSNVHDIDISSLYQDISFDMPDFDIDYEDGFSALGESIGAFFKGLLMSFITLSTSIVNNVIVWIFCESPLLSNFTKPLFLMGNSFVDVLKEYMIPLLGALGVFAPVIIVAIIISFIRRHKE